MALIMNKHWTLLYSMLLIFTSIWAQDDKSILNDLLVEDQRSIEALAMYPESTRRVILEAAGYPDALARIEAIQESSKEKFREILSPFSQESQGRFYELVRYPDLLSALAEGEKKSKAEIKVLSEEYPENIQEHALKLGRKRYNELKEIHSLNTEANWAFQAILNDYPSEVRSRLEQLLDMPEVLDILMKNFRSTVIMGAIYSRNPEKVWHFTDSLQNEIAKKRAEELSDWKAELEGDTDALKEFEAAASDFAEENGYDSRSYQAYLSENDFYNRYHLRYIPYSYWFGYPWWYTHPYWYPRPYWYYWGFYYGPGGQIVIFDFPSWYFVDWYFSRRYHHYYYPHLSNRYIVHYERHRTSSLSATSRIRSWTSQNQHVHSRNWLRNDDNRVRRLQDFGAREVRTPSRKVPTYTRPGIQRPPAQRQPSRPAYDRPDESRSREQVKTRTNRSRTPARDNMRAPEYHEQNLKKRTPTRVSPTQSRKPISPTVVPSRQSQKKPVRKRNE